MAFRRVRAVVAEWRRRLRRPTAGGLLRAALVPLVTERTWWSAAHVLLGVPAGALAALTVIAVAFWTLTLGATVVLTLPAVWAALRLLRRAARAERRRLRTFLGIDLPEPAELPRDGKLLARVGARIGDPQTWRELAYLVLALPRGFLGGLMMFLSWSIPLGLLTLPAFIPLTAFPPSGAVVLATVGLVALPLAPRVTWLLAGLDGMLARALLGPDPGSEELQVRVTELTTARGRVLDAAEVERRRIERDLHDGAQQRLVALAMDLSQARAKLDTDVEATRALLDAAHASAKQTMAELRELVRGIHPAVLTDRGLDAALSALAARAPVPVTIEVDVEERPPSTVEGVAYFVVAEALTNVAKHAQATSASVRLHRGGDRLAIQILDDGVGGARVTPGSGLAGLADRVAGVDGFFHVLSPDGGPTTLVAELPCGS